MRIQSIDQNWPVAKVSNIKHVRRWGADGAIASRRVGSQHPYSYAYETRQEDNWHRSVEVDGDGEEVGNVHAANRRTALP